MAQPKRGNSHLRGSQFIGSGLYVTGVGRIAGAVRIGGTLNVTGNATFVGSVSLPSGQVQQTDLATGASGVLYSANMSLAPIHGVTYTSLALSYRVNAVTGYPGRGLKFMPPGVAITVRALGFTMQTGPAGTGLRVSIRSIPSSGAQVHKGYVTTVVTKFSIYKSGLTATIPAGNAVGIAINRVGTTESGQNLQITAYYTRN